MGLHPAAANLWRDTAVERIHSKGEEITRTTAALVSPCTLHTCRTQPRLPRETPLGAGEGVVIEIDVLAEERNEMCIGIKGMH